MAPGECISLNGGQHSHEHSSSHEYIPNMSQELPNYLYNCVIIAIEMVHSLDTVIVLRNSVKE